MLLDAMRRMSGKGGREAEGRGEIRAEDSIGSRGAQQTPMGGGTSWGGEEKQCRNSKMNEGYTGAPLSACCATTSHAYDLQLLIHYQYTRNEKRRRSEADGTRSLNGTSSGSRLLDLSDPSFIPRRLPSAYRSWSGPRTSGRPFIRDAKAPFT